MLQDSTKSNANCQGRPAKRMRLSTVVSMAEAELPSQPPRRSQRQGVPAEAGTEVDTSRAASSELSDFPAEMYRVMQAEGHLAPTHIQQRSAPLSPRPE